MPVPHKDGVAGKSRYKIEIVMLLKGFTALLNDKNKRNIVMTAIHLHQLQKIMADE